MKKTRRVCTFFIAFLMMFSACFMLDTNEAKAFTVNDYSNYKSFKSGWFWLYITNLDGSDSKIKIEVSTANSKVPSYNALFSKASKWKVKVNTADSTNNHNFKLTSSTVTTTKDINNDPLILPIKFKYNMPAHHKYKRTVVHDDKRAPNCKFSFTDYGEDTATVNKTGKHQTSTSARAGTAYVNLIQTGCMTYTNKKRYNGTLLDFEIERPTYPLNTKHWLEGFSKGDLNKKLLNTDPASASSTLKSLVLQQTEKYATYNCCTDVIIAKKPYGLDKSIPRGFEQQEKMYHNGASRPLGTINMGTASKGVSLYYAPIAYNITYNLDGGTNSSSNPKTYKVTYPVTFSNPSKTGYQFNGWYEGSTKRTGINEDIDNSKLTTANAVTEFSKRAYGNKTITAKWTPNNYKVTFNANGGSGSMTSQSFVYDTAKNLSKNQFTRSKYTFDGWNTKADGSGTTYKDQQQVKNLTATQNGNVTLYAKWKPNQPPEITAPTVNNDDGNVVAPFLKDGKLVIQKGDKFTALNYATANDPEEGNLTNKIKVIENIPINSGKASESGIFDVTYNVSDSYGLQATKTIKVQVNDPPKYVGYDRYFFVNQNVSADKLIEQILIDDKEDGLAKPKSIELDKSRIDTSEPSEIEVNAKVFDSLKGSSKGAFKVYIVEDVQEVNKKYKQYPRFIDKDSIDTLDVNSIWRTESEYFNELVRSLNNDTPIYEYDIER